MSNHTPGPWNFVEHSWSDTGIYGDGRRIALLNIEPYSTEETQEILEAEAKANARLICASPRLLALAIAVTDNIITSGSYLGVLAADAIEEATGVRP